MVSPIHNSPTHKSPKIRKQYNKYLGKIKTIDFNAIYDGVEGLEAMGEQFCTNDVCELPQITTADIMDKDEVVV